jgi:anti-anti-sigma factor
MENLGAVFLYCARPSARLSERCRCHECAIAEIGVCRDGGLCGDPVVRCTGRLTTETSVLLKTEVRTLLPSKRRLILDLTDLSHMDSSGLGALVGLYISAKGASCELQLVNLSPRIRELLSITNVLSVFEDCGRYGTRLP